MQRIEGTEVKIHVDTVSDEFQPSLEEIPIINLLGGVYFLEQISVRRIPLGSASYGDVVKNDCIDLVTINRDDIYIPTTLGQKILDNSLSEVDRFFLATSDNAYRWILGGNPKTRVDILSTISLILPPRFSNLANEILDAWIDNNSIISYDYPGPRRYRSIHWLHDVWLGDDDYI